MNLPLFDKIKDINENVLHSKFKFLRDDISLLGERKIIEEWTNRFVDRDNKIIKEFQTSFHSAFWEFFLFALMKKYNYTIDFSHNRPDFIVSSPIPLYIEAVVSEIKNGGKNESERSIDDILSMLRPFTDKQEFSSIIDEAIVRHSNSFHAKKKKYAEYLKEPWISSSTPYIIAISSYDQINYGKEFYYSMMALLYGKYYNPENGTYSNKTETIKPGTNSPISIGLFNSSQYEEISAVIFSCSITLGKLTALAISNGTHTNLNNVIQIKLDEGPIYRVKEITQTCPEELEDGIFIFYNPYAKNPLRKDLFEDSCVVQVRGPQNIKANDLPTFARFNSIIPETIKGHLYGSVMEAFNPGFKFYKVIEKDKNEITLEDIDSSSIVYVDLSPNINRKLIDEQISEGDVLYAKIKQTNPISFSLGNFLKI